MANSYFRFKRFVVYHDRCAMKVTTDACLFGAWCAGTVSNGQEAMRKQSLMLDVGAGSGLLSLMVAQKTECMIDAVEIEAAAAEQAQENIAASPWSERINLVHADVLKWQPRQQYDCIISNPPFYENDLKSYRTHKNLAHHNEGLTLAGLFSFIKNHLKENATFFLLLPTKRMSDAVRMLAENGLHLHHKVFVKQTPGHEAFRVMIAGRKSNSEELREATITITGIDGDYTAEFISLLKDYYLYL